MSSLWERLASELSASGSRPRVGMSYAQFCREVLGVHPWKKQREIANAIGRGDRSVYVYAAHGVGKTHCLASIVCWALSCWDPVPVIVSSAPTFRQVRDQLWREIRRMWNSSQSLIARGECLTTSLEVDGGYAVGFSTNDPGRFQGIHAPRLLFIVDEANAFPEAIWEAIDSCMTGRSVQIAAIGNPIIPYGRFYRGATERGVTTMTIPASLHPNVITGREIIRGAVTREWVADMEDRYKSRPDVIESRVLARFPQSSTHALISRELLQRALSVTPKTWWPSVLGVDVARYGGNYTVVARQRGQLLEDLREWRHTSITHSADRVEAEWKREPTEYVVVDDDGVGGGLTDILLDRGLPVVPFRGGARADEPEKYKNVVTEAWWSVRSALESDMLAFRDIDPELELQLTTRDYEVLPTSQLRLESKDDYSRRTGLTSPDRADALAMACWQVTRVWSRRAA